MTEKPLILVVEDSLVLQKVAASHVQRLIECEVVVARTGREAVEVVRDRKVSLVLMDIHMPEMDGIEATCVIRQLDEQRDRHTPIVAVTASDSREHCLAAGMDDYVTKPADYQRILERWLPAAKKRSA